jgi:hypothetical protein
MKVSSIERKLREYGPNIGLSMVEIQFGFAMTTKPETIIKNIALSMQLQKGGWVVLKGNPSKQIGIQQFLKDLHHFGWMIELEEDDTNQYQLWYAQEPDRLVINYTGSNFNYDGLRPRQDLLLLTDENGLEEFIIKTQSYGCLKGAVVTDLDKAFELTKNSMVRLYKSVF